MANIHAERATKKHRLIYSKECDLRITLKLQVIFSVFNTCRLNKNEVAKALEYYIIFITPDADIWSPNCDSWSEQEDEMLGEHVEIHQHETRKATEIIEQGEYFDFSALDAMRISGEKYDHFIYSYISSAYVRIPEPEDVTDIYRMQDWLLVEDGICAHVTLTDARLNRELLDEALSYRMELSKFAMDIGGMPANSGSCELFEADMESGVSQTRADIGSTTAGHPKGVTAKMLSNIWTIPHEMAEKTLCFTSQLNRQGENTSVARNLGTNDRRLRYNRIKWQGKKHARLHV